MGKRRKKGNINPKKRLKRKGSEYFHREQEINKLLNKFTSRYKDPHEKKDTLVSYKQMNEMRVKIKKLLDEQGKEVWTKNGKRKRIYLEQLARFKTVYPKWKEETYFIYLHIQYDVPLHMVPSLKYFRTNLPNIQQKRWE